MSALFDKSLQTSNRRLGSFLLITLGRAHELLPQDSALLERLMLTYTEVRDVQPDRLAGSLPVNPAADRDLHSKLDSAGLHTRKPHKPMPLSSFEIVAYSLHSPCEASHASIGAQQTQVPSELGTACHINIMLT